MIICEMCINHLGDMNIARKMIESAKENGASLAKFQLYNSDDDAGQPYFELSRQSELTFDQAKMLFDHGEQIGIEVFFSVFGVEYVDWCEKIGVKRYKVASGIKEDTIINAVKHTEKPVIESTSGGRRFPYPAKALFCPPGYPPREIKLENLNWADGFSDHTIGLDIAKIALARGAQIIEKHFCLKREGDAPDIPWSMEPQELKELVRWEKVCREILG